MGLHQAIAMPQHIIDKLTKIKDQLIEWPNGSYENIKGEIITPDEAFQIIEADLIKILDIILKLPENDREALKHVIDDFKNTMAKRQKEAEDNLEKTKQQILLNKGATKAMKAYKKPSLSSHTDN